MILSKKCGTEPPTTRPDIEKEVPRGVSATLAFAVLPLHSPADPAPPPTEAGRRRYSWTQFVREDCSSMHDNHIRKV